MDPVVRASRSEWDAFLSEHSRLIQRFQLLLDSLDLARAKPRNEQEEARLLLQREQCQYCGREVRAASEFCDSCGSVIGEMSCQCGRICTSPDRFCDLCGRALAGN